MTSQIPVVLIHGNPENPTVWGPLMAALDRHDAFTLSPPGFGSPLPRDFNATVDGYCEWVVERLEQFRSPVDLVGHDWGGGHVVRVAMERPDLVRSWASDALGLYAPDYVWHPRAQVWQQEGPGEESANALYCGSLEDRQAVVASLGMTGSSAERVAASMDADMATAVLSLLRSAVQPVMADAGRRLELARARPGLALIALDDHGEASGTVAQHRFAAEASGAKLAELTGVDHWWPAESPIPVAKALLDFWAQLD